MRKNFIILLIIIAGIFLAIVYYYGNLYLTSEFYSMNTIIDAKIWGFNRYSTLIEIEKEINKLNMLFDDFNPQSDISKINSNAGVKSVSVSDETIDILLKSKEMYRKTKGTFNIAIAPVLKLWGFKDGHYRVPGEEEIKSVLSLVNLDDLIISKNTVFLKKKGERIDLGGIAKGYALDRVKGICEKNKVKKAIINMGGNVFVYSRNPDEVFRVGIRHPRSSSIIAVIKVKSGTFISTSGDYERYFEYNGKRYCHIIDPSTGYPADKLLSATCITDTGYVGDALSTALFVLGKEEALDLTQSLKYATVVVTPNLNVFYTDNLRGVITIENR